MYDKWTHRLLYYIHFVIGSLWMPIDFVTRLEPRKQKANIGYVQELQSLQFLTSFGIQRIEPIGYDQQKNAYWLFDDNRLWIQRYVPRLSKSPARPTKATLKTGKVSKKTAQKAKLNNIKKAAQKPAAHSATTKSPNGRSTRRSQLIDAGGWQQIPQEWLKEASPSPSVSKESNDAPVESSDSSDLSDLSMSDTELTSSKKKKITYVDAFEESDNEEAAYRFIPRYSPEPEPPKGFVRWQTVSHALTSTSCISI